MRISAFPVDELPAPVVWIRKFASRHPAEFFVVAPGV
jgi:hypothetical protein